MFTARVQVPVRVEQLPDALAAAAARSELDTEPEFAAGVAACMALVAGLDPAAMVTASVTSYRQRGAASVSVVVEGETDRVPPVPSSLSAVELLRGMP